jgi:hypothetical protein
MPTLRNQEMTINFGPSGPILRAIGESLVSGLNGFLIDIVGASTQAGALLDAWPYQPTGNDNQFWKLVPQNASIPGTTTPFPGVSY